MIIIYIFIIILFSLSFIYKKYNNPYKLYMIFGKKGSGKSTFLCKIALKYKKMGYNVYTNMEDMIIPGIRIIDASLIGDFIPEPKSCILLDECGILFDNRNYKNFKSSTRDFFKLQRHYNCVVFLASQSLDVDKKLRDLTDKMYLVSNILPYLSIIRPISKRITLVEASAMGESRIADNLHFCFISSWRLLFIPKYSKYFNSFIAPYKEYIDFVLLPEKSEKKMQTFFPDLRARAREYFVHVRANLQKIKNLFYKNRSEN